MSEPAGAEAEAPNRQDDSWALPGLRRLSPPIRFVVVVCLLLIVMRVGFAWIYPSISNQVYAFCAVTAQVVHEVVSIFGMKTTLMREIVSLDGFSVRIIPECTGLFEMVIFAACVLAYPASGRARVIGFVFGFLSIYFFNLVRIGGLLLVGRYTPDLFEFFHIYFWQITLVAIIVGNWLLWLNLVVRREIAR